MPDPTNDTFSTCRRPRSEWDYRPRKAKLKTLMEAALHRFSKQGIAETTLIQLFRDSGLAPTFISQQVGGRAEIACALIREQQDRLFAALDDAGLEALPAAEHLPALALALEACVRDRPREQSVLLMGLSCLPGTMRDEVRQRQAWLQARTAEAWRDHLPALADQPDLTDELAATLLLRLLTAPLLGAGLERPVAALLTLMTDGARATLARLG